ncbi:hypothetical protein QBC34DRAFT_465054 [Podospora aff. communis PSN243]|uniref:Transmembrane protein n=1 Tax=Podospora aff. communis PSN243 TaxID=3040156 RepID=A0AAV9H3X4_9PEZI|nr:hypothetical protein QBC34DRAFT_465054 [Podospora aff. communis PSN243]
MAAHNGGSNHARPLLRLSLLFLILCSSASCAFASSSNSNGEAAGWKVLDRRRPDGSRYVEGLRPLPRSPVAAPEPAHVVRDCQAMVTPPPSIVARQDNGQIQALSQQLFQISEQSRAVSRASQQVSQSSQQLSQSLQQVQQRLSETERQFQSIRIGSEQATQASRSLSQQVQEQSRQMDELRRSADRAISEASRSVSNAMMQNMAQVTQSFGSVLAQATRSAASLVQKAQAEATAVRGEATSQVQQAQGAALSVTQTALAVVGGIIGSSLLTVAAFFLILRYRRNKRSASRSNNTIGYPDLKGSSSNATGGGRIGGGYISDDAESVYSTDAHGYRRDIKTPMPVAVRTSLAPTPGIGYAVSYYTPKTAPSPVKNNHSKVNSNATSTMSGTTTGGFQLGDPPKKQFTLFPKTQSKDDLSTPTTGGSVGGDGRGTPQMTLQRTSKGFVTSLDAWIRQGTVSPFATMKKGGEGEKR